MKKYKIHCIFITAIFIILPLLSGCDITDSSQIAFFVAPDGNNNSPGTKEKPFATIQHASDVVREKLKTGLKKDIVVLIRGGIYPINSTITFNQDDSGTNGFRVVYRNYPGETPVFSGDKKVIGWSKVDNTNKWVAKLDGVNNISELYINGIMAEKAKGVQIPPTKDATDDPCMEKYNLVETVKTAQGEQKVYEGYKIKNPRYPDMANWKNKKYIEFVYENAWTYVICPVADIIPSGDGGIIVKMQNPSFRDSQIKAGILVNDPSYMRNAFELLDEPGEWYFDRSSKELYYIPTQGQNMQQVEAMVPVVETLLEVKGTLDNPVQNITFEGLEFAYGTFLKPSTMGFPELQATFTKDPSVDENCHSNYVKTLSGILLDAAKSIVFERCNFNHLAGAGINIQNGSCDNIIRGCRVTEIGGSGIQIGGFNLSDAHPHDGREIVKNNTVSNCYLNNIGTIYKGAVGIVSGYTEGTVIIHNDVSQIGYSGISIGWGWGYWDQGGRRNSKKRPAPEFYKVFDKPTISQKNRVENNHVYNVMIRLDDGGGVYTLSMMKDSIVKGNLIHDLGGRARGIYMDEASGGIEVCENIVYNVKTPFHYHDVGLEGRKETCKIHDNYYDIKPTEKGYPMNIAAKAGLEPKYADIKK